MNDLASKRHFQSAGDSVVLKRGIEDRNIIILASQIYEISTFQCHSAMISSVLSLLGKSYEAQG